MTQIAQYDHQDLTTSLTAFRGRPSPRISATHFAGDLFWYALWFGAYWMLRGAWPHAWQILVIAYPILLLRWLWRSLLHYQCIHYEIDSDRIHVREGILSKSSASIEMFRIHDVTVGQGLLDRLLGIGHLYVDAGERRLNIYSVREHEQLRRWLIDYVQKHRRANGVAVVQT